MQTSYTFCVHFKLPDCVHCPVQPSIIKHVISMATMLKTSAALNATTMDSMNTVDATYNISHKNCLRTWYLCVNLKHETEYSSCK